MVLILSEHRDYSTSKVIKWLCHFGQSFLRLNGQTNMELNSMDISGTSSFELKLDNNSISSKKIQSFWYRRGKIRLDSEYTLKNHTYPIDHLLRKVQANELRIAEEYLYHLLEDKKALGTYGSAEINKLYALKKAHQCGLQIPETLVTGNKKKLSDFFQRHPKIIVKPIYEMPFYRDEGFSIKIFTTLLDHKILDQLDDHFFPCLFQNAIEKKFELRIFFIKEEFYANAIFSQRNQQTSIDLRNHTLQQGSRRVPFNIPDDLAKKLLAFIRAIQLDSGSIDLIYKPNKEYVFLEVNPVGQFGMTSYLGNYRIEQKIAKYLSNA